MGSTNLNRCMRPQIPGGVRSRCSHRSPEAQVLPHSRCPDSWASCNEACVRLSGCRQSRRLYGGLILLAAFQVLPELQVCLGVFRTAYLLIQNTSLVPQSSRPTRDITLKVYACNEPSCQTLCVKHRQKMGSQGSACREAFPP